MRISVVLKFLAVLTFVVTLSMCIPLFYAVFRQEADVRAFAVSIGLGMTVAAAFYGLGRGGDLSRMGPREAMASVALSWVAASAVSGLPYLLHGCAPTYTDAFFEAMSGFSTTGSTILVNIDPLPGGLLFWRGFTHWLGGMGIIVLTLTLLPMIGTGGFQLYSAEVPGLVHEKFTPRMRQTATILWRLYVGFTAILTVLLLLGGMGPFDAVMHAMGTISTGGFSPYNASLAHFDNAYFDWVITIFMFLSGANFVLHYRAIRGRSIGVFPRDPEFALYFAFVVAFSLLVSCGLLANGTYSGFGDALRFGAFQVVSLVTTTGFVSANYEIWPVFPKALLFLCLFPGGCAGSTSGAVKQIRLLVLGRHMMRQFKRTRSPRAVVAIRLGDVSLEVEALSSCLAFFGLYLLVFAVGVFGITLFEPDLFTAISGVAATLGNVGPGFGSLGAAGNFASQAAPAKWIYSFLMLCGRLELFTVFVLFTRAYWSDGILYDRPLRPRGSAGTTVPESGGSICASSS